MSCDKAAWSRLATLNCQVREDAAGGFPLGEALLALRSDPAIALHFTPLAKPAQPVQSSSSHRATPYQAPAHRPQKGKGKSGGKGKSPPMPAELRGKYHKTASNDPICFAYNTSSGCSHSSSVKPGERCPKGMHVCAEPKCQQPHLLQQHK